MRTAAGLTQDDVCARTGIARPNLSAYENGRRVPSADSVERIRRACRVRPSTALAQHREQILEIVRAHRGVAVEVFGSTARGQDRWDSDLDLLVTLDEHAGYFDLARMQAALTEALGVTVDLVSKGAVTGSAQTNVSRRILRDAKPIGAVGVA